jgi:colanic acid/amylovoran biosynthesis glycosyltransferase
MRIAYLTSMYPAVSHTFIRRELNQLEHQFGPVDRFAIRSTPHGIVDNDDMDEDRKTFRLFSQPLGRWVMAALRQGLARPVDAPRGLFKALALARRGHRGLVRHLAYFVEALLLLDELTRRGVDHLHVHFGTNPAAVAQIARAMGGPPYSFTVHGPDEFDAPVGFSLAEKIADASFVVAISHYCSAQLRRWSARADWHKIQVVGCGVSDEFFEQARPIAKGSRALVCVGRLTPQKGQLLLLEAFVDALARGANAELVLVGDGELRDELESFIEQHGLAAHVRITGWLDGNDVRQELLAARALVLPSFAEGLPVVIMEAFALGRPVLSTYVAGIPELVKGGDNGWLVPAGSREALADAIVELMATPLEELDAMAARGRDAVRQSHYTPSETAKLAAHLLQANEQENATARSLPGPRGLGVLTQPAAEHLERRLATKH